MSLIQRRLPNGQEVTVVDPAEAALLYREIFVESSYLHGGFPPDPPEVIVDVGANIGLASMFFKQRYPGARIVAAEPAPATYAALVENFHRHVPGGVAVNVAVTRQRGTARFGYYPRSPAESGIYANQRGDTEQARSLLVRTGFPEDDADRLSRARHDISYVECRTVSLSDLLRDAKVDQVDLLKVDVEKAELDVLAGIERADWPRLRHIALEVHDIQGRLAHVCDLLRGHGYLIDTFQESRLAGTDMHMVFAKRSAQA